MAEFHRLPSLKDKVDPKWEALNKIAEERARECPSAPMPSMNHVTFRDFDQVYEPAADTYLLLDALQYDLPRQINTVWEIGCGSGTVSAFVRNHCEKLSLSICSDVNPAALDMTRRTVQENDKDDPAPLELLQCDLGDSFLGRLDGNIDVIIFNPPYVPTDEEEVVSNSISAAWAGGTDGRTVINKAIPHMAKLLAKDGTAYLVTVDDNRCDELAEYCKTFGLEMKPLLRRRTRNEFLTIQKLQHIS